MAWQGDFHSLAIDWIQLDIRSLWKQLSGLPMPLAMFWVRILFYIIAYGFSHALWCNFKSGICAKSISELEYDIYYKKDFHLLHMYKDSS